MKYARDLPDEPRDYAHPKPERPASFGRVIGGVCCMSGLATWLVVFLRITP